MTKWALVICVVFILALGALLAFRYLNRPPSDDELLRGFYKHKESLEQLRDMALADVSIQALGKWGVQTSEGTFRRPDGGLPAGRYKTYLALLKDAEVSVLSRSAFDHSQINFVIWASGFAGDIAHVGICWRPSPPEHQVANLDEYYKTHPYDNQIDWVYRPIVDGWYLWTDLWTDRTR